MVLNQSTVVGQTTAESVLDFPKNDIRDLRTVIIQSVYQENVDDSVINNDIVSIALARKGAIVNYSSSHPRETIPISTYITITE